MVSFPHDRSGNVLTVFGLSLPIILAAAGAALDYSDLTRKRSELQKLADETALASTKALATSTAVSPSQRENDARKLAERLLKDAAGTQRTSRPLLPRTRSVSISRMSIRFASAHSSERVRAHSQFSRKRLTASRPPPASSRWARPRTPASPSSAQPRSQRRNAAFGPMLPARPPWRGTHRRAHRLRRGLDQGFELPACKGRLRHGS